MTALSADRNTIYRDGVIIEYPVAASTTIYGGSLVMLNSSGYAVPGADTASCTFIGVATDRVDNSAGDDASKNVLVKRTGLHRFACAGMAITNVGDAVYLVDDQTVGLAVTTTNDIYCGIIAEYHSATQVSVDILPGLVIPDLTAHLADATDAHDASAISILDSGGYTTTANVETALAEIYPRISVLIADPGDAGAIPVTRSGNCALTTGASGETRTLAIPGVQGITLDVTLDVDGGGDATITVASAFNQTGNNTIALQDAGDFIRLQSVKVGGALVWRMVVNDGCTLTTV